MANRKALGQLIQILREDIGWNQNELGEKLEHTYLDLTGEDKNFSKKFISDLENGKKQTIEVELVTCLATVFQLNAMERRELFLAVANASSEAVIESRDSHYEAFNTLIQYLNDIQAPAFLVDSQGDIVGANLSIIHFLQVPETFIAQAMDAPDIGYSLLNFICKEDSPYQKIVGSQYLKTIEYNIQFFRGITLRYRIAPGFDTRLKKLKEIPLVRGFWNHTSETDTTAMHSEYYEYDHPVYGSVKYTGVISTALTTRGELRTTIYMPLDGRTNKIFTDIRAGLEEQLGPDGQYYRLFADWPKDNGPYL